MKKINKTPLAAAMGVAVISTFAVNVAHAEANPFGMSELSQGYMQLAEAEDMSLPGTKPEKSTAEAKCGGMMDGDKMKKGMESACGAMMKGKEGACGMMPAGEKAKEGACGAAMKMPEGKCGDLCGDNMKKCEAAKTQEGSCGAMMKGCGEGMQGCGEMMMKGKEGSCGMDMMKHDDSMKGKEGACGAGMKMPENSGSGTIDHPKGVKVVPYVPAAK